MNKLNQVALALAIISVFSSPLVMAKKSDKPSCRSFPYKVETPEGYNHKKFAPAQVERFYDGGGFIASVDGADDDDINLKGDVNGEYLATPEWVSYHLKGYTGSGNQGYAPGWDRPKHWYQIRLFNEEREVYKTDKSIDDSYTGIGRVFNRGHLAQRADMNRISPEAGCNSHVFANGVPQAASMNQGIWLGLENFISGLANAKGDVWVSAGPIYDKPLRFIGEKHKNEIPVAIPNALWKTVTWIEGGNLQWRAWIYPNVAASTKPSYRTGNCQKDKEYKHQNFLVSLQDIQDKTGLTLLPQFAGDVRETILNYKHETMPILEDKFKVGACN